MNCVHPDVLFYSDAALGADVQHMALIIGTVQPDICNCFQIHRGCENAATLVIGMISANLRSSGSGEYIVFFHGSTQNLKVDNFYLCLTGSQNLLIGLFNIQLGQQEGDQSA